MRPLPAWLTSSGLAYGVIGLALSIAGIFVGIALGKLPSERVLARCGGDCYSGRREMYKLNQQLKNGGRRSERQPLSRSGAAGSAPRALGS